MGATKNCNTQQEAFSAEVQKKIIEAISSLKFGIVSIIVQDGHVIQIEKLEKERLK
jgi:hypothetical protein